MSAPIAHETVNVAGCTSGATAPNAAPRRLPALPIGVNIVQVQPGVPLMVTLDGGVPVSQNTCSSIASPAFCAVIENVSAATEKVTCATDEAT